jgi:hypothetical protein
MTLKQKFEKANNTFWLRNEAELVKIADDYAIEFAEWCLDNNQIIQNDGKELLKIFKEEKGL